MPLPLGHAAIGFATHSLISNDHSRFNKWRVAIFIVILSNLPDLDVLLGLILQNNGSAFHRGPTHSILFALIMGFAASRSSKFWSRIPMVSFKICFMLILSHVVADYFLTDSPVSFYWPFEVNWLSDSSGWSNVMHTVLFDAVEFVVDKRVQEFIGKFVAAHFAVLNRCTVESPCISASSRRSFSACRARDRRLITVPIGTSRICATSI